MKDINWPMLAGSGSSGEQGGGGCTIFLNDKRGDQGILQIVGLQIRSYRALEDSNAIKDGY